MDLDFPCNFDFAIIILVTVSDELLTLPVLNSQLQLYW